MKKIICDECGTEITRENDIYGDKEPLDIEFKTPEGGWMACLEMPNDNRGDICRYCVLDAFARLDDRPRAEEAHDA